MRWTFLLGLLGVLALAGCGGDSGDSSTAGASSTPRPASAMASDGGAGCSHVKTPAPKSDGGQRRPPAAGLAPGKHYDVTFATNCGAFTIRVDQEAAPATAASFVALARRGFFDHTVFHRIVPEFVIQGGDPTGTGQGGPGYTTRDRPPADTVYKRGMVAMAKTGAEPAGTAGSQFFVVTGQAPGLAPEYATLGRVARGMPVVERISRLGDPSSGDSGTPIEPVVVSRAKVTGG